MRIFITLLFVFGITQSSCDSEKVNLGISLKYMPDQKLLRNGVVYKYYVQILPKEGNHLTAVEYTKYQLDGDKLIKETYDNGLELANKTVYSIKDDVWRIDSFQVNTITKVIDGSIIKANHIAWNGNTASSKIELEINEILNVLVSIQKNVVDTIHNGVSKKIFHFDYYDLGYQAKEIVEFSEGFGPIFKSMVDDQNARTWILDEMITSAEFEKRRNHGLNRIAYIDPDEGYSPNPNWETCNHIDFINDYYNYTNVKIDGGKGKLRKILKEALDSSLLGNESGYLTFRFVVNCDGEIGRIITEEADLRYDKKVFSEACRQHFQDILSTKISFSPLKINGQSKDAYMYLTFKLRDGELIEILP